MRHLLFAASLGAALCLQPVVVNAQSVPPAPVPGRALLDWPLGTLGEVPALAGAAGGGLFNPAAILPANAERLRLAVSALNAGADRGVDGQVGTLARTFGSLALGVDVARMAVSGLDRTGEGNPTPLGAIPYSTSLVSALAAVRLGGPLRRHFVLGAAARYRSGRADTLSASTSAVDVGVLADRLFGRYDVRLAAASYLWHPGSESVERPGVHVGADGRVYGADDAHEARVGVASDATRGGEREVGVYASGRWRYAEARAGLSRANDFGSRQTRTRLALGFHGTRFAVGVGHEGSDPGFGSIWQFTLSTGFR